MMKFGFQLNSFFKEILCIDGDWGAVVQQAGNLSLWQFYTQSLQLAITCDLA